MSDEKVVNEFGLDETLAALESETTKSAESLTEQTGFKIPEKFQNKSLEDVIQAYVNLEQEHGRKAQEIGELRRITDHFLSQPTNTQTTAQNTEVDDIDIDPEELRKLEKVVKKYMQPVTETLSAVKKEETLNKLRSAHNDMEQILQNQEFQKWVVESPIRSALYQRADSTYDYDAGNELLNMWKDRQAAQRAIQSGQEAERQRAMKVGTTETGAGVDTTGKKIYRRVDLIRLKQTNPQRYSELQPEIMKAYQEGRVR